MSAWRRPARRLVERLLDHEIRQSITERNDDLKRQGRIELAPLILTPAGLGSMRTSMANRNRFRGQPRRRR